MTRLTFFGVQIFSSPYKLTGMKGTRIWNLITMEAHGCHITIHLPPPSTWQIERRGNFAGFFRLFDVPEALDDQFTTTAS